MSVRNGGEFLREAVDSILGQTLSDLEFVVIDDGSTDGSGEVLGSYTDPRLVVVKGEARGLAPSLNAGIRRARADLIARMDADDISEPSRLERQVRFLADHPDHVLVGSDARVISEDGTPLYQARLVTDNLAIQSCLDRMVSPFYHGSVVFRRGACIEAGLYDEGIPQHVEDILLWSKLRRLGAMANVPEPLYRYRLRAQSVSRQPKRGRKAKARMLRDYAATGTFTAADAQLLATSSGRGGSARRGRASYELDLGKVYLDQVGDISRARRHLARALTLSPGLSRAWFNIALTLMPRSIRVRRITRRNRRIFLRTDRSS
jgi:glycosyltransferase involved in cell wall biosynthesis